MRPPRKPKPGVIRITAEWRPYLDSNRLRWSVVRSVEEGLKMSFALDAGGVSRVKVEASTGCGWFTAEKWLNGERVFQSDSRMTNDMVKKASN